MDSDPHIRLGGTRGSSLFSFSFICFRNVIRLLPGMAQSDRFLLGTCLVSQEPIVRRAVLLLCYPFNLHQFLEFPFPRVRSK